MDAWSDEITFESSNGRGVHPTDSSNDTTGLAEFCWKAATRTWQNLTLDTAGPRIIAAIPDTSVDLRTETLDSVTVTFSETIDFHADGSGSLTLDDVIVTGPSAAIATTGISSLGNDKYQVSFDRQTTPGTYTVSVGPQIQDAAGNLMDQDQDGLRGETDEDAFSFGFAATDAQVAIAGVSLVNEGSPYTLQLVSDESLGTIANGWTIDWGDGQEETFHGDTASVVHRYADGPMAEVISASFSDGTDTYRSNTIEVAVHNVNPSLVVSGEQNVIGEEYLLMLNSFDPGDDTVSHWTIDWGDGTVETIAANPSTVAHAYEDRPTPYRITAAAADEDGTFQARALGDLLVGGFSSNDLRRYERVTGKFVGDFVLPGSGGLSQLSQLSLWAGRPLLVRCWSCE